MKCSFLLIVGVYIIKSVNKEKTVMQKQCSDIELVETQDLGYLAHSRKYRIRSNLKRGIRQKDPFEQTYYRILDKWEFVIQRLLSTISQEEEKRILKHKDSRLGTTYREIDFITSVNETPSIFCELKLKENYKENLSSKSAGWSQLNKSLSIAKPKYDGLYGLAICVDMSAVYGLESHANQDNYCQFDDVKCFFNNPTADKPVIWLDSLEIAQLAIKHNFLTKKEVENLKIAFKEYKNPSLALKETKSLFTTNPFSQLQQMAI